MDLNQFDTRQKAEAGVEVPLIINGETVPGSDDNPVTFTLKGVADPEVHKAVLDARKNDTRTPKEVIAADMKLARIAVTGWSNNFDINGETFEFSKANIEKVFAIPAVRQAMLKEIFDQHHFMNGS